MKKITELTYSALSAAEAKDALIPLSGVGETADVLYKVSLSDLAAMIATGDSAIDFHREHRGWRILFGTVVGGSDDYQCIGDLTFVDRAGNAVPTVGGVVHSTATHANYLAGNAFDGDVNTFVSSAGPLRAPDTRFGVGYVFAEAQDIGAVKIVPATGYLGDAPASFAVQYSDDAGISWTTYAAFEGISGWLTGTSKTFNLPAAGVATAGIGYGKDFWRAPDIGASQTLFGANIFPSETAINGASAGRRIIVESLVHKPINNDIGLYLGLADGSMAYNIAAQSDGNVVIYYRAGATATALKVNGSGADDALWDYSGYYHLRLEINIGGAGEDNAIYAFVNGHPIGFVHNTQISLLNDLRIYVSTSTFTDIKWMRYRWDDNGLDLPTYGTGIDDAPEDGKQYARKDGVWSEVVTPEGGVSYTPKAKFWRLNIPANVGFYAVTIPTLDFLGSTTDDNLAAGGTPFASQEGSGAPASSAFDGNDTTTWQFANGGALGIAVPVQIGYEFATKVAITRVRMLANFPTSDDARQTPNKFTLEYSDDGVAWAIGWAYEGAVFTVNERRTMTGAFPAFPVTEAPEDGKQYARQDGDWTEVVSAGGGGGVIEEDAPATNFLYARMASAWVAVDAAPVPASKSRTQWRVHGVQSPAGNFAFGKIEFMSPDGTILFTNAPGDPFYQDFYFTSPTEVEIGRVRITAVNAEYSVRVPTIFNLEYLDESEVWVISEQFTTPQWSAYEVRTFVDVALQPTPVIPVMLDNGGRHLAVNDDETALEWRDVLPEAPQDGQLYVRKDGLWVVADVPEKLGSNLHKKWRITKTSSGDVIGNVAFLDVFGARIPKTGSGVPVHAFDTVEDYDDSNFSFSNAVYTWPDAQDVAGVALKPRAGEYRPRTPTAFTVAYSDDEGVTWTNSYSFATDPWNTDGEERKFMNPAFTPPPVYTEEAPEDGKQYARKDGAWVEVVASTGGGGFVDAPIDGKSYARKSGTWVTTDVGNTEPYGRHRYWRVAVFSGLHANYAALAELDFRAIPGGADLATPGPYLQSGQYGGQAAAMAFDSNPSSYWESQSASTGNGSLWLGHDFTTPVSVTEVALMASSAEADEAPTSVQVQYSDDGTTWTSAWLSGVDLAPNVSKAYKSPDYVPSAAVNGSGNAFPSDPAIGDRFFRADRLIEYAWNGTLWLSTQLHTYVLPDSYTDLTNAVIGASRTFQPMVPFKGQYDIWIDSVFSHTLKTNGTWIIGFGLAPTVAEFAVTHLYDNPAQQQVTKNTAIQRLVPATTTNLYFSWDTNNYGIVDCAMTYRLVG